VEDLLEFAATRGALGHRVVGERLHDLKGLAAGAALVFVGGHGRRRGSGSYVMKPGPDLHRLALRLRECEV
jgi:hypothetical protein